MEAGGSGAAPRVPVADTGLSTGLSGTGSCAGEGALEEVGIGFKTRAGGPVFAGAGGAE